MSKCEKVKTSADFSMWNEKQMTFRKTMELIKFMDGFLKGTSKKNADTREVNISTSMTSAISF